jgi:hypothetical protein
MKNFKLRSDQIRNLVKGHGACFASDRILVDGQKVGYMYREIPDHKKEYLDSGWTFMAGDETQEYADNPDNWAIYDVNTVCNYDPEIIPYLESRPPIAFGRDPKTGKFVEEELEPPE